MSPAAAHESGKVAPYNRRSAYLMERL